MVSPRTPQVIEPTRVHQTAFLGVIWSFLALAIVCTTLRFLARVRTFKKFLLDDYLVLAALVFATATAIIWQVFAPSLYIVNYVFAGLRMPDQSFPAMAESYWKATLAVFLLYYSSLWAVKLSFLFLFRRLGAHSSRQKYLWWPIFLFTVATYIICISDLEYRCLVHSLLYVSKNCVSDSAGEYYQLTLKLNCAWDVATDFFIMLLPLHLLRGVQMRLRRKLALIGLFSLVIVTMVVSILRVVIVSSPQSTKSIDSSLLFMWSSLEVSIAIVVASLASFRNLFSRDSSDRSPPTPVQSSNLFMRQGRSSNRIVALIDTIASMPEDQQPTMTSQHREAPKANANISEAPLASAEHVPSRSNSEESHPAEAVHVRSEVIISHESRADGHMQEKV